MSAARPMFDAPKDGTRILLWIEHENYKHAKTDREKEMWAGWCVGNWTEHNGGGWTWCGLCGKQVAWAHLPKRADGINTHVEGGE